MRGNVVLSVLAMLALTGMVPHARTAFAGSFKIEVGSGPFISGSRIAIATDGVTGRVFLSVLGPGRIHGGELLAPVVSRTTSATIIASARGAIAVRRVEIVPAPAANEPLLAVATYRNGIALHDPRTFRLLGYTSIGGAPGDVAFMRSGTILAPDTDSDVLASIARAPWSVHVMHGVALGNEIAVDHANGDVFVSNRDAGGFGALTRISPHGAITRVRTGEAAEGLAIDTARGLVYVGNVNSNSVTVVAARTMQIVRTIRSVERTFGLALDPKAQRLFVVSNTSPSMPSRGGYVAAIDLRGKPHIVERSARMVFPIGAALDRQRGRLFVTDEAQNQVYVLNSKTLRPARAPLHTCDTPWRPRVAYGRLYVPCASANKVDVFDLRTLRRVRGAPFATGGYPLSVALWRR